MLRTRGARLGSQLLPAALGLGPASGRAASGARGQEWLQPAGYDTGVKVYNSLTRRKDPLIVSSADAASWYSCGPTVYDHAHLGHACSYVRFDIIRRILTRVFGCSVVMVMGVTDVDDKIIKRANELNVYMRVTENIPQIVAFIAGIIASGHAYSTARGNVYFDLQSRGAKYGKLVGVVPDPMGEPGDSDKRHAGDFALWKAAKPQEPFWASPWGNGRPGWHIECSTLSSLVFGSRLDIHSGGIDLAFPHHENEIAQCEAFHRCPQWGNYFLHSGGSPCLPPGAARVTLRWFQGICTWRAGRRRCPSRSGITSPSRTSSAQPPPTSSGSSACGAATAVDYSDGAILEARRLLHAVAAFVEDARAYMRGQLAGGPVREDVLWDRLGRTKGAVQAALADDFNTPRAVDAVVELIHHGNRELKAAAEEPRGPRSPAVLGALVSFVEQFFETVGISLAERQRAAGAGSPAALHSVVEELVRFRQTVRRFALAAGEAAGEARRRQLLERRALLEACDALRRDLSAHGVRIKDRSDVSTWELLDPRTEDPKAGR